MSTVSKIIIKQGEKKYEWSQTDETLTIKVNIHNVLLKNIDIFQSDLLLKVNAQSIKFFLAVDFLNEIDYKNSKNRVQLLDSNLEVLVFKKQPKQWATLEVQGLNKQELMDRRNASVNAYYALEEQLAKQAKSTVYKMEKDAIDNQMALERHQRKHIKAAKTEQLESAKDDLFNDLDEVNEMDK